jgi:hypothetical protein
MVQCSEGWSGSSNLAGRERSVTPVLLPGWSGCALVVAAMAVDDHGPLHTSSPAVRFAKRARIWANRQH